MAMFDQFKEERAVLLSEDIARQLALRPDSALAEELFYTYFKFLFDHAQELSTATFNPTLVRSGDLALPEQYNDNFQAICSNLKLIYRWLQQLGNGALVNYNYLLSRYNGLHTLAKRVLSLAADLDLLLHDKESCLVFSDTFSSLDRIDLQSSYSYTKAAVDLSAGLITLPLSKTLSAPTVTEIKINPGSNGSAGDSLAEDGLPHNNLTALTDGNPTTWFNYELLTSNPQVQSLVLDLTCILDTPTTINRISLWPHYADSTGVVTVNDLQVSLDGRSFTSLKKEIAAAQNNPDIWQLSSLTNKYGGIGVYYFIPKYCRYLRLILEQQAGISLGSSQQHYLLGLRDVKIEAVSYESVGEIRSATYQSYEEIKKIALEVTQLVQPRSVCAVEHYLSIDQGETWLQVQPLDGTDPAAAKVLSFNVNDPLALTTARPVASVKYRAVLRRQLDNLNLTLDLPDYTKSKSELLSFPNTYPYTVTLEEQPLQNSLFLGFPLIGSCGKERLMSLGYSDGAADQYFTIPLALDSSEIEIYVGKQLWRQVANFSTSSPTDRVYVLNLTESQLTFGNGTTGLIPQLGRPISLRLPAERLLADPNDEVTFTLRHPTDGSQDHVQIFRVLPLQSINQESLPRETVEIQLQHRDVQPASVVFSDTTTFAQEKLYVNGKTELTAAGQYALDYSRGRLYLYQPLPAASVATISYQYAPKELVPADTWRLQADCRSIALEPGKFFSHTVTHEDLSAQANSFLVQLASGFVVPGSLQWPAAVGLTRELLFIDGIAEFLGTAYQLGETVPAGVTSFTLQNIPLAGYQLYFTDQTALLTQVDDLGKVVAPGFYYVNYLTGQVTTYQQTTGGTASYYYHTNLTTFEDCFSVDYRCGQVHLYKGLPAAATVSYQYTHYEVVYDIAEPIPKEAYTVDPKSKTVVFTDARFLADALARNTEDRLFFASYQYVDQSLLTNASLAMFTPILADYAIKAVPITTYFLGNS